MDFSQILCKRQYTCIYTHMHAHIHTLTLCLRSERGCRAGFCRSEHAENGFLQLLQRWAYTVERVAVREDKESKCRISFSVIFVFCTLTSSSNCNYAFSVKLKDFNLELFSVFFQTLLKYPIEITMTKLSEISYNIFVISFLYFSYFNK